MNAAEQDAAAQTSGSDPSTAYALTLLSGTQSYWESIVHSMSGILTVMLATAVPSILLTWLIRYFLIKRRILDIPNARSSHSAPVPRGGGLAIVLVQSIMLIALAGTGALVPKEAIALFGGGGVVAAIGLLDDRRPQSAGTRFLAHVVAAIFVVALIGGLRGPTLLLLHLSGAFASAVVGVLALTWATNLFNFMDGIDAIAATEAVFVALAGGVLAFVNGVAVGPILGMLGVAGAAGGFLVWNWPPARIFMGDVGSGYLGFMLLGLGMVASRHGEVPIEVWLILGGVFIVDATVTLVRRVIRGDRWVEAHRLHAYQHAARRFVSHRFVVLVVTAINVFWLFPWAWVAAVRPDDAVACLSAALVPLVPLALLVGAGRREH